MGGDILSALRILYPVERYSRNGPEGGPVRREAQGCGCTGRVAWMEGEIDELYSVVIIRKQVAFIFLPDVRSSESSDD